MNQDDRRSLRHDLLTPMNHIIGYSEILAEEDSAGIGIDLLKLRDDGRSLLDAVHALFDDDGHLIGDDAAFALVRRLSDDITELGLKLLASQATGDAAQDLQRVAGATVKLRRLLELSAPAAPAPAPSAAPLPPEQIEVAPLPHGPLLVVDDHPDNRDMLARRLQRMGYEVHTAEDGLQALEMLETAAYDLVLLDVMMPRLDGVGVLRHMQEDLRWREIPVIMISALQELDAIVRCIALGADDYLAKPFEAVLLKARVAASLEKQRLRKQEQQRVRQIEQYAQHLETLVRDKVQDVARAHNNTIIALTELARNRDAGQGQHLGRIQSYCRTLAEAMAKEARYAGIVDAAWIQTLAATSALHDLGNVGIPDFILQKPGPLTEDEFEIVKRHTSLGAASLLALNAPADGDHFIRMAIQVIECHHERWDGSGYPFGLPGEAIPLAARVVAIADVYDALRDARPHKAAQSHEQAVQAILSGRGNHFDPALVDIFERVAPQFAQIYLNA